MLYLTFTNSNNLTSLTYSLPSPSLSLLLSLLLCLSPSLLLSLYFSPPLTSNALRALAS